MIFQAIVFIIGIFISSLLLTAVYSRKPRTRKVKFLFLLGANSMYAASVIILPFHNISTYVILILALLFLDVLALNRIFSSDSPKQQLYDTWHDDPKNWRMGIFYYNPEDKRLFPPKRIRGGGWTVNFANPYSILATIVLAALIGLLVLTLATHYDQ
jgi:uncharacterized membrane protein